MCGESGINRATFYRHYAEVKDILKELQSEFIGKLLQPLKKPSTEKDWIGFLCYLQENASLAALFIQYTSAAGWTELFKTMYQSTFDTKSIHELDAESQHLAYTYLAGGTYFLLRQWLVEGIDKSPQEIVRLVLRIVNKDFMG